MHGVLARQSESLKHSSYVHDSIGLGMSNVHRPLLPASQSESDMHSPGDELHDGGPQSAFSPGPRSVGQGVELAR